MAVANQGFFGTSPGKKVAMAISGALFFGFVTVHMLGNLQVFLGPKALNDYAAFLQGLGGLLWVFRIGLAAAFVVHVIAAALVTWQSLKARPRGYRIKRFEETTYAARTMRWGGPVIALFVVYHLLHLTLGTSHHAFTDNVYNNVVLGFQIWWISLIYMFTLAVIGLHLYHGVWSMFQSVGANSARWSPVLRGVAAGFAVFVAGSGLSVPVAALTGVIAPV